MLESLRPGGASGDASDDEIQSHIGNGNPNKHISPDDYDSALQATGH